MAYTPPAITSTGLAIPSYQDILNALLGAFSGLYGSTVYLGVDSADYQDIAVRALHASDNMQGLQAVYLSFNPLTAIGPSLDLLGKLVGTARKTASFSTVVLTLTGTPGAVITNGVAQDVNGNFWNLPATVTIGVSGTANATATAQQAGTIAANPGVINKITTPTAGWTSVINGGAANPGQPVETDSQYRARLIISQAKPSLTLLAGTEAAIAALTGVTRSIVYECQFGFTCGFGLVSTAGTSVTLDAGYPFDSSDVSQSIRINGVDYTIAAVASGTALTLTASAGTQASVAYFIGDGIALGPAHSMTAVVEGGANADIAQAIYNNRGVGCLTNGTTSVIVSDPNNGGLSMTIAFDRIGYKVIYVALSVHGLNGFTTAIESAIATGVVDYLNSLGIGESVVSSELYGAALTARPDPDQPLFSIRSLTSGFQAAATTGSTTSGSAAVTLASGAGVVVGQVVIGSGIPAGTTVSAISGTALTLSANATATATGVALTFFSTVAAGADISIQFDEAAQGSIQNVVITLV